ncbi:MAG: hypothetical protein ACRCZE_00195 [Candidatus Altimarinota bacterium]
MAKKNELPPVAGDLDKELEDYLKDVNRKNSSAASPLAKISGKVLRQKEQAEEMKISKLRGAIPTPKISQEIESVAYFTYDQIIKSIGPNRSHGLEKDRGQTGDKSLIVQMAVEFEAEYGPEAGKLLTSLETFYGVEDRFVPNDLELTIELLKKEFLEKISLRDRVKAIEMLLMMKPSNLNLLEFSQLLVVFVQWIRLTRPILVDKFLMKVFSDQEYVGDELADLNERELDELRRFELIELLKKFNDAIQEYGYDVGNDFIGVYFDQGEEQAEQYLQCFTKKKAP